jgi:hypothetical protein
MHGFSPQLDTLTAVTFSDLHPFFQGLRGRLSANGHDK